jgi:hypothetical protein
MPLAKNGMWIPGYAKVSKPHLLQYLPQSISAIATAAGIIFAAYSLQVSNDNLRLANRAYVSSTKTLVSITSKGDINFDMIVQNGGNTPATEVELQYCVLSTKYEILSAPRQMQFLGAMLQKQEYAFKHTATHNESSDILPFPVIVGILSSYKDVFQESWNQGFCIVLDKDGATGPCDGPRVQKIMFNIITHNN